MEKFVFKIVLGVVLLMLGLVFVINSVTTVDADEIVVKQNFLDGKLQVWNTPGVHWQNFGRLTRYKKSSQYWFSARENEGKKTDDSIKVRFNDGGHGSVSGSLRYNLPLDENKMLQLHMTYGSMETISHELMRQVVNKSVFMTGPLMSSRESYAEKRADLINFISDQILHGVYKTERKQTETTDPISGQKKTVDYVEPKVNAGKPNGIDREEESPVEKFGLNAYNITINGIDYDPQVEEQIKQQQQAIMAVQQAMVDAKKAEQAAITVAKQGEAEAAKAKWAQEVIKATEMTKAQQEKDVAELQAEKNKAVAALAFETAKLDAQTTVTSAKADADAKKLAMQANNYFLEKLNAAKEVAIHEADARGAQPQVPTTVVGASGGVSAASQDLLGLALLKMTQTTSK